MTTSQAVVTALGALGIVAVNHYFLRRGPAVRAQGRDLGPQELTVVVDGGYEPSAIEVEHGRPVRLHFERRDSGSCTEEVVFGDFGIRRFLPTGKTTTIEFTPERPGTYEFTCGMSMVHGRVVAK